MNAEPAEIAKVTPEMLAAYVSWEPPCELDMSRPAQVLGLIRAAFFAGWTAHLTQDQSHAPRS